MIFGNALSWESHGTTHEARVILPIPSNATFTNVFDWLHGSCTSFVKIMHYATNILITTVHPSEYPYYNCTPKWMFQFIILFVIIPNNKHDAANVWCVLIAAQSCHGSRENFNSFKRLILMMMSKISVLFQWYAKTHDCASVTVHQVNHIRLI